MDPELYPSHKVGRDRKAESLAGQANLFGGEEPPPVIRPALTVIKPKPKRVLYLGKGTDTKVFLWELSQPGSEFILRSDGPNIDYLVVDWDGSPEDEIAEETHLVKSMMRNGVKVGFFGGLQKHHRAVNQTMENGDPYNPELVFRHNKGYIVQKASETESEFDKRLLVYRLKFKSTIAQFISS